jgi:hypothetical protein
LKLAGATLKTVEVSLMLLKLQLRSVLFIIASRLRLELSGCLRAAFNFHHRKVDERHYIGSPLVMLSITQKTSSVT